MSRIRGPYVRFCERDEAVMPHPTRFVLLLLMMFAPGIESLLHAVCPVCFTQTA